MAKGDSELPAEKSAPERRSLPLISTFEWMTLTGKLTIYGKVYEPTATFVI